MDRIDFRPVSLGDQGRVFEYTSKFGEGSCQHSPVAMYSLYEKYGDSVCIEDDMMFVLRKNLCNDTYRVYMAPLGAQDLKRAYERIIADAHSYKRKAAFITITQKHADFLKENFSGLFDIKEDRDLSEYIFSVETMRDFPGKIHARRRTEIRTFWRDFGERTTVSAMTKDDVSDVAAYAVKWLTDNADTHDEDALNREMICIRKQLASFEELGISGTVIRVDGAVGAFCYGVPLNDEYYDVLIEKGDRAFPGIYRVLRQESTKLNVSGFAHINFEEDVGVPGLRRLKESYGPEYMITKYRGFEK